VDRASLGFERRGKDGWGVEWRNRRETTAKRFPMKPTTTNQFNGKNILSIVKILDWETVRGGFCTDDLRRGPARTHRQGSIEHKRAIAVRVEGEKGQAWKNF